MLENVLMECTSYQVAGQPMSKADSDQLEEEIAEAVLQVFLTSLVDATNVKRNVRLLGILDSHITML